MKKPIVIIGMGQLGGVFARGFLKSGYPILPILPSTSFKEVLKNYPEPAFALLAVGKGDLPPLLTELPNFLRERTGLLQNELVPKDWEEFGIAPTVLVVWFEKKHRQPIIPLRPTLIFGPHSHLVAEALNALDLAYRILKHEQEFISQLALKNLFILTTNIAGLVGDDTVGELFQNHPRLVRQVFLELSSIQEVNINKKLDHEQLWKNLKDIVNTYPDHASKGRSALERLHRTLHQADELGMSVPQLCNIREDLPSG
jgi:hypothetical protein